MTLPGLRGKDRETDTRACAHRHTHRNTKWHLTLWFYIVFSGCQEQAVKSFWPTKLEFEAKYVYTFVLTSSQHQAHSSDKHSSGWKSEEWLLQRALSVRGSNLPPPDIYNAIIKEKKLICRGKKLSQFTPASGQIHTSPQAFIWLARWKLRQIEPESKKQLRKILSHYK